jgi:hypothetical protein
MNGSFPSGCDNSTYEISEKFYDELVKSMQDQMNRGKAKLI